MTLNRIALALAFLIVPAAAMAQGTPAKAAATNPIERVLQRRAELGLTPDQVAKLERIRQEDAQQEQKLVAEAAKVRGASPGTPIRSHANLTPAQRQALRQKMHGSEEMQELRQLHQKQITEARAVLTSEQNARAWQAGRRHDGVSGMRPHSRGQGAGRGAGAGRGPGGGRGPVGR